MTRPGAGIAADIQACLLEQTVTDTGIEARCRFPADLDIYRGHFPGRPLVPGVYCIELVRTLAFAAGHAPSLPCTVRHAKFVRPILPEAPFRVELRLEPGDGKVRAVARFSEAGPAATALAQLDITFSRTS
jgi:3-hydroxyacyl-[acyl-carrier-protein] dehydratase